jgi:hypothetical protein
MAQEGAGIKVSLLIISKFVYNPQNPLFCYLGLDINRGRIVRPVPSLGPDENDFFWPPSYNFGVGETHVFEVVPNQDPSIIPLPHRNNDVLVTYVGPDNKASVVDMPQMFDILCKGARNTIEEALGIPAGHLLSYNNGRPYVQEGENCQSFGVYKCTSEEAKALSFHDDPNHVVLVLRVLETARPLFGYMGFNPRRCFLTEVGLVFRPQTTKLLLPP